MRKSPTLDFRGSDSTMASRYRFPIALPQSGAVTVKNYRFRFLPLTEFCVPIYQRTVRQPSPRFSRRPYLAGLFSNKNIFNGLQNEIQISAVGSQRHRQPDRNRQFYLSPHPILVYQSNPSTLQERHGNCSLNRICAYISQIDSAISSTSST